MEHARFMDRALALARQALAADDFPVGCVVVQDGRIIAEGTRINSHGATPSELDHAEMIALRRLEALGDGLDRRRLTLYATLEPCLMCYGAILIGGIETVVYAYEDAMGGGTACDRAQMPPLYRDNAIQLVPGVRRAESLSLFQAFFRRPHNRYWCDSLLARYTLAQSPS